MNKLREELGNMQGCLNIIKSNGNFIKNYYETVNVPERAEKIVIKATEAKESGLKVKQVIKNFQVLLLWEAVKKFV